MATFQHVPVLKYDDRPNDLGSESTSDAIQILEVTSDGRTDIQGLFRYLDHLQQNDIHVIEATYIGNRWYWNDLVPFEHFGFVFATTHGEYFSLDFGRRGIVWDVYDDYPDYPDNTFSVSRFRISQGSDIEKLGKYCQETKPFFFLVNDCKTWSDGLKTALQMELVSSSNTPARQESQRPRTQPKLYGYVSCM